MKDDFVRVRVKLLTEEGQLPKAAKDGDVAFDLFSSVDYDLELALRNGITTLNTPGTIDTGYRGEVKVILINHGDVVFHVSKGDRIAQLAIRTVPKVQFTEVDSLGSSDRGEDGFGSTGL
ncbi:MAG: dUTP diphosphatase [Candidatus Thorarchaeota archaeon]